MRIAHCTALVLAVAAALAGCRTNDGDGWTHAGPARTSFRQADRTCDDQQKFIAAESARADFYVKCMAAFGWSPGPGADVRD